MSKACCDPSDSKNCDLKFLLTMAEKTRYSDEELQEFKELILEKLDKARKDYDLLKGVISGSDLERHCGHLSYIQGTGRRSLCSL